LNAKAYNTEILSSAQEASPHIWVNGEKYVFSDLVVKKGLDLYKKFKVMTSLLSRAKTISDLNKMKQNITGVFLMSILLAIIVGSQG